MQLLGVIFLLFLGYLFGKINENKHYESLLNNENNLKDIFIYSSKNMSNENDIIESKLVLGSVVISIDYYKQFLAFFKFLFGGNVNSYETLIERARREAVVRMKKDAIGFNQIVNLKLETSRVFENAQAKNSTGSIEVLAYGTAIKLKK